MSTRKTLPNAAQLQQLLDEGDTFWFARNPRETERVRPYFRNEKMDYAAGEPGRYVVVSRDAAGGFVRRFRREAEVAR